MVETEFSAGVLGRPLQSVTALYRPCLVVLGVQIGQQRAPIVQFVPQIFASHNLADG